MGEVLTGRLREAEGKLAGRKETACFFEAVSPPGKELFSLEMAGEGLKRVKSPGKRPGAMSGKLLRRYGRCSKEAAAAGALGPAGPTLALTLAGLGLWAVFLAAPGMAAGGGKKQPIDWGFLRSGQFWILTALLFCQNGAETSVTGWLVTYFDQGILSASVSPYTVTLLWGATMAARLRLAFVRPPRAPRRAMIWMGLGCTVFYAGLMLASTQAPALLLLLGFALSIAGMNPTAVGCAGRMTSVTSLGVMLPVAGLGAVVMPWAIGLVADTVGLRLGMACNLLPCAGLLLFALLAARAPEAD